MEHAGNKKRKQTDPGTSNDDINSKTTSKEGDATNPKTLKYVEFYSGVGGWTMALQAAVKRLAESGTHLKLERLAALDHSDLCNQVFQHNFGQTVTSKSKGKLIAIERLDLKQLEAWSADVWVMSPPCQPHTRQHSSQEQDLADPRSASFLHICDLLEQMHPSCRPTYIFLENVVGFEASNSFERWLSVLQNESIVWGIFI